MFEVTGANIAFVALDKISYSVHGDCSADFYLSTKDRFSIGPSTVHGLNGVPEIKDTLDLLCKQIEQLLAEKVGSPLEDTRPIPEGILPIGEI